MFEKRRVGFVESTSSYTSVGVVKRNERTRRKSLVSNGRSKESLTEYLDENETRGE